MRDPVGTLPAANRTLSCQLNLGPSSIAGLGRGLGLGFRALGLGHIGSRVS